MSNEISAWVIRPFPDEIDSYKTFDERGLVALGWPDVEDLSTLKPNDWDGCKAALTKAYGQMPASSLGQWAGNLNRFRFDMQVGNLVLVPYFDQIAVGIVSSDYYYSKEIMPHAPHRRNVKWLRRPVRRYGQAEEIVTALKGRQTIYRAWLGQATIADIMSNQYPWHDTGDDGELSTRLAQFVLKAISGGRQQGVNQTTFETIFFPELLRFGLDIRHASTRNTPGDGDVDVVMDLLPDLKVFFQLKYQVSASRKEVDWAMHQVREAVVHAKNSQDGNTAKYICAVVFAGPLAEEQVTGWRKEDGKEDVLVLVLNEMDEWFSRWIQSMTAKELMKMVPKLTVST